MTGYSELIATVAERIGHTFSSLDLLVQATTHKSFANEAPSADEVLHNERLEFLGDAVLNLVISEMLMEACPDSSEGDLSRLRASLVNERELAQVASHLGLGDLLRLGKGEERSGGRKKASLLADLFEAVLGAVFLDGGLEKSRAVARLAFGSRITTGREDVPAFDPKSRLQVVLQQRGHEPPDYRVVEQAGPDHRRRFTVAVCAGDDELGRGIGTSKKEAEQAAAHDALSNLDSPDPDGDTSKP
jgi:ribonuclease-3